MTIRSRLDSSVIFTGAVDGGGAGEWGWFGMFDRGCYGHVEQAVADLMIFSFDKKQLGWK